MKEVVAKDKTERRIIVRKESKTKDKEDEEEEDEEEEQEEEEEDEEDSIANREARFSFIFKLGYWMDLLTVSRESKS